MTYDANPLHEDGCFPEQMNLALAAGLTECGIVAVRWFNEVSPLKNVELLKPPARSLIRRLKEKLTYTFPVALALTRDANALSKFAFDRAWSMQYQAMLILDPYSADGRDLALAELQTRREWRDFTWPSSVLALCMPGVDGDVMVIAAENSLKLRRVVDSLKAKCDEASFVIE